MKKRVAIYVLIGNITIAFVVSVLCFFGLLWPNSFFANNYSVKGIDVSNYQGDIDWMQVENNNSIKFAYLKATEGKNYQDKYFQENWNEISRTRLYKGAYHYFTIGSSGKDQAMNFINTVPVEKGCLPPVVDIEENGIDKIKFNKELKDYLSIVEEKYHQKPIIYTIYDLYDKYIKDDFQGYDIWIRDIIKPAKLSDNREWTTWQYCNRGRVNGISTYVDLNVYNKNIDELEFSLSK